MTISQSEQKPVTAFNIGKLQVTITPLDTPVTSPMNDNTNSNISSIPVPGSTVIIRSVSCGRVLKHCDRQPVLAFEGGIGCMFWECVDSQGWLGFRNRTSGCYIGMDSTGKLICRQYNIGVDWDRCSRINVRQVQEQRCVIFASDDRCVTFSQVGVAVKQGVERLAKVSDGILWEFIKVL